MNNVRKIIAGISALVLMTGLVALTPAAFAAQKKAKKITVTSSAYKNGGDIPSLHAFDQCEIPGALNISPPLKWKTSSKTAKQIKSYAVTIVDLHPIANKWVHLQVANLPADITSFAANRIPADNPEDPYVLKNSFGSRGYGGPCPPPKSGPHTYELIVYGLNTDQLVFDREQEYSAAAFRKMLKGKVVAEGKLKGKFIVE